MNRREKGRSNAGRAYHRQTIERRRAAASAFKIEKGECHEKRRLERGCAGYDSVGRMRINSGNASRAQCRANRHAGKRRPLYWTSRPSNDACSGSGNSAHGYSHFKFAGADVQQGSVETGAAANDNDTGAPSGLGTVTAIHDLTANSTATVLMFHADDPEAKGAFDAAQVIKLYRW